MPALKRIGAQATAVAVALLFDRLAPALAVGLVAMAHELHADAAKAEAARRA